MATPAAATDSAPYSRGSEEFSRVLAFSDGLFAIAMTLLVVGIAVPPLANPEEVSDLANALNDLSSNIISFFISFAVIGRYWMAHHDFFSRLERMDSGFIGINLVYLAFVAFLPFPTAVLGIYFENPLSVVTYAVAVGIVSGMEVVLFRHAHRNRLMRERLPEPRYRFERNASLLPLAFFALSIPLAFVSTTLAVVAWFGVIPAEALYGRTKPED